jgi:hypothetical protein
LQDRKTFLAVFVVAGFVMKMAAEFVHEICGHGIFVLLFGGTINSVYISVSWPYEYSYIDWSLPNNINSAQMALIYAGGILVCLFVSFLTQAFLFVKKKTPWYLALTLFWLAFWTFTNSTGYLIIGGLTPFRDAKELIALGVLTGPLSLLIGLAFFAIGFVALSWILRKILNELFASKRASLGVSLFWLIIPVLVLVMLANPERGLQVAYLPLTFIPTLISFVRVFFGFIQTRGACKSRQYRQKITL